MNTLLLIALSITLVSCAVVGSTLEDLKELDTLIENKQGLGTLLHELLARMEGEEEEEADMEYMIQQRTMEIVDQVYSSRGLDEGKFESRKNGDQCEKAADDKMIIATCENNKCEDGVCKPLCDAYTLGDHQRYRCKCNKWKTGSYCNVDAREICKDTGNCLKNLGGKHCYTASVKEDGYWCFDDKYKVLNPTRDVQSRSLDHIEEIGRFSEVVQNILRRNMKNNH